MQDHAFRLPAHPSLERLQKQAKELLRASRAGSEEARERFRAASPRGEIAGDEVLGDAQFVIAREHGLENWARLKQQVNALRTPALAPFEQLAQGLAEAYAHGDREALRQINAKFGTSFPWECRPQLALADARDMVAQSYGLENWAKFAESVMRRPEDPRSAPIFLNSRPPFYQIDWKENRLSVRGPLSEADWQTVASVAQEYGITCLNAGGVTDAAMSHIARLDGVRELDLDGATMLTGDGALRLRAMTRLERLRMGGPHSPLTDRGLQFLSELKSLRLFHCSWTQGISDAGLGGLANCSQLEEVNLMGSPAGDGAIAALAGKAALRRFNTGRAVTNAGIGLLHQLPVFKTWSGGEMEYGLMSFDAKPNSLLLDGPFTDAGLANLAGLDGLFSLGFFWHCPAFTSAGLAHLRHLANLGFLGCQGEHCDDEAMRQIAAIPQLRMLMGQGSVAGDPGWTALSQSQTIEYIWGRECPNLTGRGFAALAGMPALRGLAVSCRNVDDVALARLPDFPELRGFLSMDVPDDGFRHVGRCEKLENLWCMYCQETGDGATGHLAGLSLKSYYAGNTKITDRSLEILGGMESLEKLHFWECRGLTDAGAAHLARLPRLQEVKFEGIVRVTREALRLFGPQVRVSIGG